MSTRSGFRLFLGQSTKQVDTNGARAIPLKWYYEPTDYESNELYSKPYDSAEEVGAAIDTDFDPTESPPVDHLGKARHPSKRKPWAAAEREEFIARMLAWAARKKKPAKRGRK